MSDYALGQVVGFDTIRDSELLQFGHEAPVTANHPRHQTIMTQVIETTLLAVTLTRRINQGQVARPTEPMHIGLFAFKKQFLQRNGNVFGETDADETAGRNGVAILDQAHGIARRDHLASI